MGKITAAALLACLLSLLAPATAAGQTEAAGTDGFEAEMRRRGLVDIRELDDGILVELKYATDDNFVGRNMYGTLRTAYLLPHFARKVVQAQRLLKELHPQYTLLIYDAARPLSVQRRMRRAVEGTGNEAYVADGTRGGRHNYGVAVDLTIADAEGRPLEMGTGFDHFGRAAWVGWSKTATYEGYAAFVDSLVRDGEITPEAAENRKLLLGIMYRAGLRPYVREWWHYQEPISMPRTRELYEPLDF